MRLTIGLAWDQNCSCSWHDVSQPLNSSGIRCMTSLISPTKWCSCRTLAPRGWGAPHATDACLVARVTPRAECALTPCRPSRVCATRLVMCALLLGRMAQECLGATENDASSQIEGAAKLHTHDPEEVGRTPFIF